MIALAVTGRRTYHLINSHVVEFAMPLTKLTLSVDPLIVAQARRLSAEQKTSISALFSRFIATMVAPAQLPRAHSPITRRALRLAAGAKVPPKHWDYRTELADLLSDDLDAK
jgi:hypothetical protein